MAVAFIPQSRNQKSLKSTQRDLEKNCFYIPPIRILQPISFECQTIITSPMEKGCWTDRKKSTRIWMPSKRGSFKDLLKIRRLKFLWCFQQGIGNNNLSMMPRKYSNNTNLLFIKSRIAPLKETSLPQLQLLAVFISIRSINFITQNLQFKIHRKTLWTDSRYFLH